MADTKSCRCADAARDHPAVTWNDIWVEYEDGTQECVGRMAIKDRKIVIVEVWNGAR